MAMFNHSCDPNIVRVDNGKWVIAAACTGISKGYHWVVVYIFININTYSTRFSTYQVMRFATVMAACLVRRNRMRGEKSF